MRDTDIPCQYSDSGHYIHLYIELPYYTNPSYFYHLTVLAIKCCLSSSDKNRFLTLLARHDQPVNCRQVCRCNSREELCVKILRNSNFIALVKTFVF